MTAPDLIFHNARVLTMAPGRPTAEAFSVRGERVIDVGEGDAIRRQAGPETRELDAEGRTIVPGLTDAHSHLETFALGTEIAVDYRAPEVSSIEEIVERLRRKAADTPRGNWLLGQGSHFQDTTLVERRYPDRQDLDRASADHPIVARFSYHVNVLNSAAIRMLGVTPQTPAPPGGRLELDPATGEVTGRFFDMYESLNVPDWPFDDVRAGIRRAMDQYLSFGVTAVGDIPLGHASLPAYADLYDHGDLPIRLTVYPTVPSVVSVELAAGGELARMYAQADPLRLRIGGVKLFLDGGSTSAAAALHEPYVHKPGYRGEMAYEEDELAALIARLDAAGHQLLIHAIGDRAQDTTLAAYERLPRRRPLEAGPHRIEHGGNLFMTSERLARYRRAGIVPAPNPPFIYTLAGAFKEYVGEERARGTFPFRTLLRAGIPVPGNSDSIGIDRRMHNPMFGIWCLVNRRTAKGTVSGADEAITAEEGLRMYTLNGAIAMGEARDRGSIEADKLADFAVLDRDLREVPAEELLDVKVVSTWVGGRRVYQRS